MADTYQLDQFCSPLSYDLAGRSFHLVMDDCEDTLLHFLDGENLQIARKGEAFVWESYRALKADAATWFVHIQPALEHDLVNIVFVLDTAQRLVTMVTVQEGYDPEHPRLMQVIPHFGAIRVPGMELPTIRHHLSRRMVGEHIYWHYDPFFAAQHVYHSATSVRLALCPKGLRTDIEEEMRERFADEINSPDPEVRKDGLRKMNAQIELRRAYPFYEEPAMHIWINDHLNLFSFIEENMCRRSANFHEGGGGMIVLQDTVRLIDMGLCFNPDNYRYSDTYLLTAYGQKNEDGDPVDDLPSPYNWDEITGMPSIRWEIPEEE